MNDIPRVVFDTNILFSAVGWLGNPHQCVQAARQGKCLSLTCEPILAELAEKLQLKRGLVALLHFNPWIGFEFDGKRLVLRVVIHAKPYCAKFEHAPLIRLGWSVQALRTPAVLKVGNNIGESDKRVAFDGFAR